MDRFQDSQVTEKTPMAPTVSIEQMAIVRPIKVISLLCSVFGVFLSGLSIAATTWFQSDVNRAGLWEDCIYLSNDNEVMECRKITSPDDWLVACRVLCISTLVFAFMAIVITGVGLTTNRFSRKYKYYIVGLILMIIAAICEISSLILYPVKYSEGLKNSNLNLSWGMGWAYGLGWIVAILLTIGSALMFRDKDADELIYREITCHNDSIEEYDA